jgi:hypothetical protein
VSKHLEIGQRVKVIKAFKSWDLEPTRHPGAWQSANYVFQEGDVLTYTGQGWGWGSDPACAFFVTGADGKKHTAEEGWRPNKLIPGNGWVEETN